MIINRGFRIILDGKQAGTVAPSEIGAGPGQRIPMEILGYRRSLLPVLKYGNTSTRTVDFNP